MALQWLVLSILTVRGALAYRQSRKRAKIGLRMIRIQRLQLN